MEDTLPTIHPSAIIDARARLADDVRVGPGCIIEGDVTIDAGTQLVAQVYLKGPLHIGRNNRIYPNACLGLEPQDRKFDPDTAGAGVVIGDDNLIREGATIHRATGAHPTRVGNHNFLMCTAHMGHDSSIGNHCVLANGVLLAGHVQVADNVTMGGNAVVHQFCRLGRLVMMSGVSGVVQDVPPFCTVYSARRVSSLNFVGLRRAGLRAHVDALKRAFDLLYRQDHTNRRAVELIEQELGHDPLCLELATFVRESKRGVTPQIDVRSERDAEE